MVAGRGSWGGSLRLSVARGLRGFLGGRGERGRMRDSTRTLTRYLYFVTLCDHASPTLADCAPCGFFVWAQPSAC